MTAELKDLTAQQASLTAAKQEVSKRIAELFQAARKLLTFLDVAVREHYGNRSEKLVEFGLQPFRSAPRVRLVGPDGVVTGHAPFLCPSPPRHGSSWAQLSGTRRRSSRSRPEHSSTWQEYAST